MPDLLALQKAIDKFNEESVPVLVAAIERLVESMDMKLDQNLVDLIAGVHDLLDRIDGARLVLPPRKR